MKLTSKQNGMVKTSVTTTASIEKKPVPKVPVSAAPVNAWVKPLHATLNAVKADKPSSQKESQSKPDDSKTSYAWSKVVGTKPAGSDPDGTPSAVGQTKIDVRITLFFPLQPFDSGLYPHFFLFRVTLS